MPDPLHVLYADNHLLVVHKPAGLPVQGDSSGDVDLLTLGKAWIRADKHKPGDVYLGLVHRLDRPARGVVVLARTSKAAARLSAQFRERTTQKTYRVVVHGVPPKSADSLVHFLESDERGSRVVSPAVGKEARLDYRVLATHVLATGATLTHLEVELHSGRKHQIRVQLASVGCPVLGDLRYGAPAPLADRGIALLAWRLVIQHPTLGQAMTFQAADVPGWPWNPLTPRAA